ncbi:hypothetical protein GAY28_10715 [Azospirillum brasilense]|nr:hypothetical protein [Azospirillum brasilense]
MDQEAASNEIVGKEDALAGPNEREIVEAAMDSVRLSSVGTDQDIFNCLIDEMRPSNIYRTTTIKEWWNRDKIVGVLFAHEQVVELIKTGTIAHPADRLEDIPRSTLILTENKLKRIVGANGAPAFPALEANEYPLHQAEEKLGITLPMIKREDRSRYAQLYRESARHLLTHDARAVLLWRMFARNLKCCPHHSLDSIPPEIDSNNGQDGGVDDMLKSPAGYLAIQVKGGTTYDSYAKSPKIEAAKFFIVDGSSQMKEAAPRQRANLWPFLLEPCQFGQPGMTWDDALILHYLAVGKRVNGSGVVRGKTKISSTGEEIPRAMFVTGLDVIVLKPSVCHWNRMRIDVSESSDDTQRRLESLAILDPKLLDSLV